MFRVPDDADDRTRDVVFEHLDLFPDRILVRPETARHRLVDDENRRRVGAVLVAEKPAANQRDLGGAEIASCREIEEDLRLASGRGSGAVEKRNPGRPGVTGKGQAADQRGGFYSGNLLDPIEDLLVKIPRRIGLGVLRARQTIFQGEQVLRLEPDVGLEQFAEAANQQAGRDQEQDRERDLRDDESAAHPIPARAAAAAASAFFQSGLQLRARQLQRRHETEQPAGDDREREREEKDAGVDRGVLRADKILRQLEQSPQAPVRQEHARAAAGQPEDRCFRQQLPDESPAARAQRGAHGHFPLPREAAGQQQVRQVRARDQQNRSRCRKEKPEHRAHVADDELPVKIDLQAAARILFRIGGGELARDRVRFRLRLGQAGLRFQMAHEREKPRIAPRRAPGIARHR